MQRLSHKIHPSRNETDAKSLDKLLNSIWSCLQEFSKPESSAETSDRWFCCLNVCWQPCNYNYVQKFIKWCAPLHFKCLVECCEHFQNLYYVVPSVVRQYLIIVFLWLLFNHFNLQPSKNYKYSNSNTNLNIVIYKKIYISIVSVNI